MDSYTVVGALIGSAVFLAFGKAPALRLLALVQQQIRK